MNHEWIYSRSNLNTGNPLRFEHHFFGGRFRHSPHPQLSPSSQQPSGCTKHLLHQTHSNAINPGSFRRSRLIVWYMAKRVTLQHTAYHLCFYVCMCWNHICVANSIYHE